MHGAVEEGEHPDVLEALDVLGDVGRALVVVDLDGDLADRAIATHVDRDDVADQPLGVGDPSADLRQLTADVRLIDPEDVVEGHLAPSIAYPR